VVKIFYLNLVYLELEIKLIIIKNNFSGDLSDTESPDLCLISLKYLHQFASMLRSMYQMPACPMFSSARRLQSCTDPKLIDTSRFSTNPELKIEVTLEELDRPVKILHVWFLLIDELTLAIETCHKKHKISAMEMLFNMFKSLNEIPGI
jgi:brefeldin A-inhibited guanine nucleotide-exchange protein 3